MTFCTFFLVPFCLYVSQKNSTAFSSLTLAEILAFVCFFFNVSQELNSKGIVLTLAIFIFDRCLALVIKTASLSQELSI